MVGGMGHYLNRPVELAGGVLEILKAARQELCLRELGFTSAPQRVPKHLHRLGSVGLRIVPWLF
jgi:hypothetical protein